MSKLALIKNSFVCFIFLSLVSDASLFHSTFDSNGQTANHGNFRHISSESKKNLEVTPYKIKKIVEIKINSTINPTTYKFLKKAFYKAEKLNADAILIMIDTPGGLVSTTKDILTLFGTSKRPIIVWVGPEGASATSAGAIIASGAHFLFMSHGSNIGAAAPVTMGGDIDKESNPEDETTSKKNSNQRPSTPLDIQEQLKKKLKSSSDMKKKAVNDLVSLVRSLSEARGRNETKFAEMITEASSFTSAKAKEMNIIDDIVSDKKGLVQAISGKEIQILGKKYRVVTDDPVFIEEEMSFGMFLLDSLANPSLAYMLFLIGAALIYFELQAPGGFIAGSIGVLCLIIAAMGFQVLPLNLIGLGLMILAFALFMLEIYVTSFGILSIFALTSLIFGSTILFDSDSGSVQVPPELIWSVSLGISTILGIFAFFIIKEHKLKKVHVVNPMVGKDAQVIKALGKDINGNFLYQVKVSGELWNASSNSVLTVGEWKRVKKINESKLHLII